MSSKYVNTEEVTKQVENILSETDGLDGKPADGKITAQELITELGRKHAIYFDDLTQAQFTEIAAKEFQGHGYPDGIPIEKIMEATKRAVTEINPTNSKTTYMNDVRTKLDLPPMLQTLVGLAASEVNNNNDKSFKAQDVQAAQLQHAQELHRN